MSTNQEALKLYMPEEMAEGMRRLAAANHRPLTVELRLALAAHLDRHLPAKEEKPE